MAPQSLRLTGQSEKQPVPSVAASARARSIERRKLSVGTPQEAVIHTVRVTVDPRDRPQLIEA